VDERREYVPREQVMAEVETALAAHAPGEIDWVTFVGSGETCLHSGLGRMIRGVKNLTDLPLAVITNGSLLHLREVRDDLAPADVVLPSLDAGDASLYRAINRPHPQASYDRLLQGLVDFRRVYRGKLWVEVMLVRGLNDGKLELQRIAKALNRIQPDAVHINLPARPPAEDWVQPPDEEGLMRATSILGEVAVVVHPVDGDFDLSGCENIVDAVVAIITRHPMRQQELLQALARWAPGQVRETLTALEASGRAQVVERFGSRFWSAVGARYPATRDHSPAGSALGDRP
jgi:wyosine [tRNA(Phe)-imidazoG37] synthetase (radical SAM superfamily)